MKTKIGLQLHGIVQVIAPGLFLALLLSPLADAVAQESKIQDSSRRAGTTSQQTQPSQAPTSDNDHAPVPPMPPLDSAQAATPTTDLLPDSPGSIESTQLEPPQPPVPPQSAQPQEASQFGAAPPSPPVAQDPLGAAAAKTVPTVGIAASRPAGAALAPGKQRRVRTILIRMGAIVGAAAAVGVTMALTEASPSKPPGAH